MVPDPAQGTTAARAAGRLGADFRVRLAASVVMGVAALFLAWVGGFLFLLFWLAAAAGIEWEWQRLMGGERMAARIFVGWAALIVASSLALRSDARGACLVALVGAVAVGAIADPARRWGAGAGVVYAGALAIGVNLLRASPAFGMAAILWLFGVVWGADVMAYLAGRLIGGPKLWPRVSPGKTWSGACVGALASVLVGEAIAWAAAPESFRWPPMAALALVVSIAAQGGDLFESALKRRAGVKDSSQLIPGHGGLMDRLDGFTVAVGLTAAIAYVRSKGFWIAPGLFL